MKKNKFYELEGLRGMAAVAVMFYHYFLAFYAFTFLGPRNPMVVTQNNHLESSLYGNPVMVFLSGTFSVAIFFVLSGFVLSIGFFQTRQLEIVKKLAAKRYLRLMIPALASIIICFLIYVLGISHIHQAADITKSGWLGETWNFVPNIFAAIRSGLFDIFVDTGNGYNNVLWTMTTEFSGSFLIFGFLALFGNAKYRIFLYALLLIATFNTWFMAFVAGMAIADLYQQGRIQQKKRSAFAFGIILLGLFLGGYPIGGAQDTIYSHITIFGADVNWTTLYLTIGAILLVVAVLSIKQVANIFRMKYISRLGKYTFSLYLIHLAVLYTFTTLVFVHLYPVFGLNKSAILSVIISLPVVGVAAFLFEKYVDAQAIRFSSYVANIILGYSKAPMPLRKLRSFIRRISRKQKMLDPEVSYAQDEAE